MISSGLWDGTGTLEVLSGAMLTIDTGTALTTPIAFAGTNADLALCGPTADLGRRPVRRVGHRYHRPAGLTWYAAQRFSTTRPAACWRSAAAASFAVGDADRPVPLAGGRRRRHRSLRRLLAAGYAASRRRPAKAVEALRPGDAVLALADGAWVARRVRWVGRTTVDLARHPQPDRGAGPHPRARLRGRPAASRPAALARACGVRRWRADAGAGAAERRDGERRSSRRASPTCMSNSTAHAVLCAEGLPAESYLDTGNRAAFAGAARRARAASRLRLRRRLDERACAPLVLDGPRVAAVHARLRERGGALGSALTASSGLGGVRRADAVLAAGNRRGCVAAGGHAEVLAGQPQLRPRLARPRRRPRRPRRRRGALRLMGGPAARPRSAPAGTRRSRDGAGPTARRGSSCRTLPRPATLAIALAPGRALLGGAAAGADAAPAARAARAA